MFHLSNIQVCHGAIVAPRFFNIALELELLQFFALCNDIYFKEEQRREKKTTSSVSPLSTG